MTDETTDLRQRIDGWLDGLPEPGPRPFVRDAVAAGDRIRRRRRQGTVLAVAAAVLALGVGGALLRSTVEAPGPAPTPGGPGPSASGARATVRYPDGTVTWPAPADRDGWVVPGVTPQPDVGLGRELRDRLLAKVPRTVPFGGGSVADAAGAGITQSGPGRRTTDLRVRVNDVDGSRVGLLTVRMTRGGLSDQPMAAALDPCGSWPSGSKGLGLPEEQRSVLFRSFSDRTCALHRSGGSTVVRWEGHGTATDSPGHRFTTRIVFTVRPDGTAVYVSSATRVQVSAAIGPDLRAPRDWAELEQLAATLPVPAGLGEPPDRPADCSVSDLEARLGRDATGTGPVRLELRLRNVGVDPCWLGGVPTFEGANPNEVGVPLGFRGDAQNAFSGEVTGPGVLEPGADGAVWLTEAATGGCRAADRLPRYDRLEIVMPSGDTLELPFPEQLAGGCPGSSSRMGPLPRG